MVSRQKWCQGRNGVRNFVKAEMVSGRNGVRNFSAEMVSGNFRSGTFPAASNFSSPLFHRKAPFCSNHLHARFDPTPDWRPTRALTLHPCQNAPHVTHPCTPCRMEARINRFSRRRFICSYLTQWEVSDPVNANVRKSTLRSLSIVLRPSGIDACLMRLMPRIYLRPDAPLVNQTCATDASLSRKRCVTCAAWKIKPFAPCFGCLQCSWSGSAERTARYPEGRIRSTR